MIPVNYLAVVVAAIANMALGFLWYGPLFGKKWIALMQFTPEHMAAAKAKGMTKQYSFLALTSLLTSYVLSAEIVFANAYFTTTGISGGLMAGFWSWLGFIVPITLGTVLWEGKSWTLWVLNAGYYLVALCAMGAVLASF